jgi:hypothetical protein
LFLVLSSNGIANPGPVNTVAESEIRNGFWSFGLSGLRHTLKAGNGNEVLGNTAAISIGTGYLRHKWYSYGTLNILLGPYEPTRDRQLNVDFEGSGATYWLGFSAQDLDLRSAAGGYGFVMGLDYSDISGHSVGRNRQESGDPANPKNVGLINKYSMHVSQLAVIPSIFFCWLEPGRLKGNTPELLRTRVEGYVLTIGIGIPFLSKYRAGYVMKIKDEETGRGEIVDKSVNETGKLEGFSIIINFTSLLGV